MSLQRKIEREQMKNWLKTNKIAGEWKNFQANKYRFRKL